MTGEHVREKSRDEQTVLPKVEEELQVAVDQAQRYGADLRERYGLTNLWLFAVVGIGLERVV